MGVWSNRNFRLLWCGGTVSAVGSWLLVVAAPFQVFRLTGSPLATGLALLTEALPAMLLAPWAGVLVDRWSRRTTMVVADVISAGAVALLLLGTRPDRIGFIYIGLFVENLAVVFGQPAALAILPAVVGKGGELASANSLSAFSGGALRLVTPPLGTILLAVGGWEVVVGIDVTSYLVSAGLIASLTVGHRTGPIPGTGPGEVVRQLREGLRFLSRAAVLRGLLIASCLYWTANAGLTVLLVPFVVHRLGRPGEDLGVLLTGLGLGYLIGSAVSRPLLARCPTRPLLVAGYAAVGTAFLILFNAHNLVVATVAAAASGIPGAVVTVAIRHRTQTSTPDAILGRVGAAFDASDATAAVIGALVGPAIVAATSLGVGLNVLCMVVLSTALVVAVTLPSRPATAPV